jgi:hypothetical protein
MESDDGLEDPEDFKGSSAMAKGDAASRATKTPAAKLTSVATRCRARGERRTR